MQITAEYRFPLRFLPLALHPSRASGGDLITDPATGASFVRCNAMQLLLYGMAVYPVLARDFQPPDPDSLPIGGISNAYV